MNINHERLVPGAITYWGDVVGDITDQQDLVDYVASHGGGGGGGNATWGSITGNLEDQTDLNTRITDVDNLAADTFISLDNHIRQNDAAFAEAFSRISALEQGGGGGGVTPEEFNAHKAQNTADFQIVDGRLSSLEQNPGVSQQTFAAHADQNTAQFQAIDAQFQNYATNQHANELYLANFDYITATKNELNQSIQAVNDRVDTAVTTEQCQEPGLTDYTLTSLIWENSNTILAMDDYTTGDNGENRDLTIWGSYMDENDDYRVKFGNVKTTYELNQGTGEYELTGQTFGEMMTLTRREGIEFPVVDRPDDNQDDPDDYVSSKYILGMQKFPESTEFVYVNGSDICFVQRDYVEEDGEMVLSNELRGTYYIMYEGYTPIDDCYLPNNPDFTDNPVPEDYPIERCITYESGKLNIGNLDSGDWTFNGIKLDPENNEYGLYKITPVEDGSEITYEEEFTPFVAAEAPDTSTDATYVLKATVLDGEVTYEWVPEV